MIFESLHQSQIIYIWISRAVRESFPICLSHSSLGFLLLADKHIPLINTIHSENRIVSLLFP